MADIESAATTLSSRPVGALDQDKEPQAPRDRGGDGLIVHLDERRGQGRLVDDRETEFDNILANRAYA